MSAFVVSNTHIDALLTAALCSYGTGEESGMHWYVGDDLRQLTRTNASEVGALLLAENQRSVNNRYDRTTQVEDYEFHKLPGDPDPITVLNAIRCFEYQACEHPEWIQSEAAHFINALQAKMIRVICVENETWEIDDPNVFLSVDSNHDVHYGVEV